MFSTFKASALDFSASLNSGYANMHPYEGRFYTGVSFNFEFESNFGIHYTFLGGNKYFHMPLAPYLGLLAAGASLKNNAEDSTSESSGLKGAIAIAILVSIIPETVSFKIPIFSGVELTPYVSPLQLDCYSYNGYKSYYPMFAFGSKIHIKLDKLRARISPYIEYRLEYSNIYNRAFSTGIELTYRFDFS
tara:strand:+ start:673 stop:1242 length:570 start_codon:yes stop_codon:yes gene_type:complete